MSGGSWDYLCHKMQDAADELKESNSPLRRAFGEQMSLYADAMHDIEWVDSGGKGEGGEVEAIQAALGSRAKELEFSELKKEASRITGALNRLIRDK